ncbi:ankyrin repeat domain-containing protein 50 [Tachysurus ichikawai]
MRRCADEAGTRMGNIIQRCVLLPLLSCTPPPQALFLLVDSIDEGMKSGGTESSSGPLNPRSIGELLSSHHEQLPPWLLLICSARRQNKNITKLFTGKVTSTHLTNHSRVTK